MGLHKYSGNDENEKYQCITFDSKGNIMGSTDTLFHTARLTTAVIKKEFPFLWKIITYLRTHEEASEALFFPHIEFECNGYRSICDFTFMRSEDALGIRRFICMIYDNSIHYKELITAESKKSFSNPNLQF